MNTMPSESYPVFFRLRCGLPIHLAFPSTEWVLQIQQISGGGHPFILEGARSGGGFWELSDRFGWRDDLEDALYTYGVEFRHDRISGTIVRGLVWRGWAEIVPPPFPKTLWHPKRRAPLL